MPLVSFATAARRVLGVPSAARPADSVVSASTAAGLAPGRLAHARPRLATATTQVLTSPLTNASLDPAIAAAFGINTDSDRVSRAQAMSVPAVRRARAIIAGTIGTFEWQALRGDDPAEASTASYLLAQPDPNATPQFIFSWTVDDLFFYGVSWWHVTSTDARGFPRTVERIARERVLITYEETRAGYGYRAYLDGRRVPDNELIRFDGPDEGILATGATTLRTALMLDAAVRRFARLDVPLGYLTPAEGAKNLSTAPGSAGIPGDDRSEVDLLLDGWEVARAERTTAYLNAATRYETVQLDARAIQLAEAKQEQAAEVSRLCNLPPRYVNAPQASGMTYATTEGDRRELYDLTLRQYVTAIGQRLSMGDVTPAGTRVAPDVLSWLHGDTKAILEAGQIGIATGVLDAEEVRTRWLKLPAGAPGLPEPPPPPTGPPPP